jgi:hypothetical protein
VEIERAALAAGDYAVAHADAMAAAVERKTSSISGMRAWMICRSRSGVG